MILFGTIIAMYCTSNKITVPYRSQTKCDLPSASSLSQLAEGPVRNSAIRKTMNKGFVGVKPMPHFSLGLESYVQATSPIRRYSDSITHRQIFAFMEGKSQISEDGILALIDELSSSVKQALDITKEDQYYSRYLWFKKSPIKAYSAQFLRWLRPIESVALVHLDSLAMDLPSKIVGRKEFQPGTRLEVVVDYVDDNTHKIYLINA